MSWSSPCKLVVVPWRIPGANTCTSDSGWSKSQSVERGVTTYTLTNVLYNAHKNCNKRKMLHMKSRIVQKRTLDTNSWTLADYAGLKVVAYRSGYWRMHTDWAFGYVRLASDEKRLDVISLQFRADLLHATLTRAPHRRHNQHQRHQRRARNRVRRLQPLRLSAPEL